MKLGLFADPHYCRADRIGSSRRPRLSYGKIQEALEAFRKENVDLVICMGDLVDHCDTHEDAVECLEEILGLVKASGLPFRNVPGNHDFINFTAAELATYGLRKPPYSEVWNGTRFVVLDGNYRSDFRHFEEAGIVWTDANLTPDQLAWLKTTLEGSAEPCVILVHETINDVEEHHVLRDAEAARKILTESGKVSLVIQGHYHHGHEETLDGIRYLTLPAMCEGEENRFFTLDI